MLNFKKLASTLIFSLFAFQSTVFAVPRYAKVVLLGGKGSGKTTIQKLINKDYNIENIPHTTQISYISVPVFYDNKGNFTFDEDRDVQRYNKEVILNICDTPSENEDFKYAVLDFVEKRPTVAVFLANTDDFKGDENLGIENNDNGYLLDNLKALEAFDYDDKAKNFKCRKIVILTHEDIRKDRDSYVFAKVADREPVRGYLRGLFKELSNFDTVKVLTLYESEKQEENKNIKKFESKNSKIENNLELKLTNNENTISREINLEYIAKIEEIFNQNNKEDLKKYADTILNSIARSVYKYGINNLPVDSNDSEWSIIDGELKKGH